MIKLIYTIILCAVSTICIASDADSLPSHNIDSIIVKSYRFNIQLKDVTNKVEIITRSDINKMSSINIADIVKKSTSSEAVDLQGLASGVEFRGFTPNSLGVNKYSVLLVDGIPMGTKNAAATTLFNAEGIEIFKGPFSSLYGSGAMGGFINIITPQTKGGIRGGFEAGYGSYNTSNIAATIGGNIFKRLDFDLGISYYDRNNNYKTGGSNLLHMTGYEKSVLEDNARNKIYEKTTLDKTNATLRLGYDFRNDWRLNLYNELYYTSNAPSNNMLWGMDGQTSARNVLRNYHRADLTTVKGRHSLRFSPYFSRESSNDTYLSKWGNTSGENSYTTYGFQLQDVMHISSWMQLAFGVDNFSQRYISRQFNANKESIAPWQPDYTNYQTSVFAQSNINLLDNKLTSIVGIRYDNTKMTTYDTPHINSTESSKNYNTVNPNVAIKYKITPSVNVHTSIGTAFLAPDAFMTTGEYRTYTLIKGNPDLKPEKSLSYDLGVGYISKNRALQADATLFITEYKNKIIDTQLSDYTTYTNSERATVRGYEAMLSFDLGRALYKSYSLNFYANYTRIFHSKLRSASGKTDIRYLAQNSATMGIDFTIKGFSARINGRYIGSKINDNYIFDFDDSFNKIAFKTASGIIVRPTLINDTLITMPDFMVLDIHLGYSFTKFLALNFKLDNCLNELYAERDGYYMPGRNFAVSVNLKF